MGPYYETDMVGGAWMGKRDVTKTSCLTGCDPWAKAWKSAHNEYTRIDANDGSIIVRYHTTDILEISADGSCLTINVEGYLTQSTMKHLRDALRRHGIDLACSRAGGVLELWDYKTLQFNHTCDGYCVLVRGGNSWKAEV